MKNRGFLLVFFSGFLFGAPVYAQVLPEEVIVTGGGIFCDSTLISATGGSGGTIYFQGQSTGGTSLDFPSTSEIIRASGQYYFRSYHPDSGWGPEGSVSVTIDHPVGPIRFTSQMACYVGLVYPQRVIFPSGGEGGTIYYQSTLANGTSKINSSSSIRVSSPGLRYFRAYNEGCGWGSPRSINVTFPPNFLTLTGNASGSIRRAWLTIQSTQKIGVDQRISYYSTTDIILNPGFSAEAGSVFVAFIEDCY